MRSGRDQRRTIRSRCRRGRGRVADERLRARPHRPAARRAGASRGELSRARRAAFTLGSGLDSCARQRSCRVRRWARHDSPGGARGSVSSVRRSPRGQAGSPTSTSVRPPGPSQRVPRRSSLRTRGRTSALTWAAHDVVGPAGDRHYRVPVFVAADVEAGAAVGVGAHLILDPSVELSTEVRGRSSAW